MKTYKVTLYEDVAGYVLVTAKDETEAEEKVEKMLEEEGFPNNATTTDRSFSVTSVKKITTTL